MLSVFQVKTRNDMHDTQRMRFPIGTILMCIH